MKHPLIIGIRVNDRQRKTLCAAASKDRRKLSDYVRDRALLAAIQELSATELRKVKK